jgi:hypothetical protein
MAKSIRQSIIESVIARLQTITTVNGYETNLGSNVFDWKVIDVEQSALPCVIVKDTTETITTRGGNHNCVLSIELEAKSFGSDKEVVRNIIADMIKAIGVDPNFDAKVYGTTPVENETLDFEHHDKLYSTISMNFEVKYSTLAFQPYQ